MLWLGAVSPQPLFAQAVTYSASLSGSVVDSSGGAIPDASVTLSNPDKGFQRTQPSMEDGRYVFTLLAPGNYVLRIGKSGFQTYVQSGIVLAVGQTATQDVTLTVGAVTQEVKVTAGAPLVNTTNANVGMDVTSRQAVELPINLRNVFTLVLLDSSTNNNFWKQFTESRADQDGGLFIFGGGRFGTTTYLLDGHWNGSGDWDAIMYVPGLDELQEFRIMTNTFTA